MFNIFRPARNQSSWKEGVGIVADLDALIDEPIRFKLHGKVHTIKPISSQSFLVFTNNLAKLWDLREKNQVTPEELITKYFDLMSSVCETITVQDIKDMTQPQIASLFQLVLDAVSGKAQAKAKEMASKMTETEKKTLN